MKNLMRLFAFIFAAAALAACTGEPPEWWNPGGKYSNLTPPDAATAKPAVVQPQKTAQVIKPAAPAQVIQTVEDENFAPVQEANIDVEDLPAPSVLEN